MPGTAQAGAIAALNGLTGVGVPAVPTYIALLTADPTGLTTIAALSEVTTSGYSRQSVSWGSPTMAYPSVIANSNLLTFGPMSANMSLPAQWAALVTSSSGTSGSLLYTWILENPQQVLATEDINIAAGALTITES